MNISLLQILESRSLSTFISVKLMEYSTEHEDNSLPGAYVIEDWVEEWQDRRLEGELSSRGFAVAEIDTALEKIREKLLVGATDRECQDRVVTALEVLECLDSDASRVEWGSSPEKWVEMSKLLVQRYLARDTPRAVGRFVRAVMGVGKGNHRTTWLGIRDTWQKEDK